MSAKDNFVKQVQENNEAQQSNEERVKKDIQEFRSRVFSLAKQVEQWLHGTGVQVSIGSKRLDDETVSFALSNSTCSSYEITTVQLRNNTKSAKIEPEWLYGFGLKGSVVLVIDTPNRSPRQQKFGLCMGPDESWIISREGQRRGEGETLTEETFFMALESLA